jgi:signal transduction histidine kinase
MVLSEVIILAIAVIANFLLAGFVYLRNPRSATHKLFTVLTFTMSLWSVINYFSYNVDSELMHTFPRSSMALSKRAIWIWAVLTLTTMVIALSPLLFPKVELGEGVAPKPTPGPGMILFVPIAIGTIPLGIYYLIKKLIRARGIEKTQLQFLFLGVVLMYGSIVGLLFVAVNVFNSTFFIPFAALFTLPFSLLAAYTIIRHRLLDIRAAIARSLSLTVLIGAVLLIYGLLLVFAVPVITDFVGIRGEIIAAAAALVSIPLARYVQKTLTQLTDRFLFQSRADYRQALVEIGDQLSSTINIDDVTSTIIKAMKEVVRSKKTVILLQESDDKELVPVASEGVRKLRVAIPHNHALLEHLRHSFGPIVKDELALAKEQEQRPQHITELEEIENALIWLDAAVVVPLFVNKELTGIIVLGDKLSGEPYLQDDTNFLAALAPQAATTLENARLYQESLEFGKKLKVEVERATHELAIANEQLRDLDKAKSEFLSVASHQLYTPLTALRGYLSMLREGDYGTTPPKQKPVINILEQSSERLITLIKNLLDISRIESGRLELNLESLDLATMAKELVRDLLPNAKAKKLILEFEEPGVALPHVVADRQRLRQVMLNFIDNSIKYTEQGRIDVTLRQSGDQLIFAVTDTGKGLTQQEMSKLFNKFTRVGGADRFHTEGAGLGLYVAKQIVKEHHGEVEVKSPGTGQGSTFSMRLPLEGAGDSLRVGEKAEVEIKAAE